MDIHIEQDEFWEWVQYIGEKLHSIPASEQKEELEDTFVAFARRLQLSPQQIHALRLAKAECTQCLDTGFYYGGHYGSVRVECKHPSKYKKDRKEPDETARFL